MAEDYGVSLKITADTSDLDKIPQKVEATRKEIEKPVAQTIKVEPPAPVKVPVEPELNANVFQRVVGALGSVRSAISGVMRAFGVIGVVTGLVMTAISAFRALKDRIDASREAAEKLRREMERTAYADSVSRAAASYDKLTKSISEANRLEKERNAILDQRKRFERDNEDAERELAKQTEIAALDPNGKDYAARKGEIERKYASAASDSLAARVGEDARDQSAALYRQADDRERDKTNLTAEWNAAIDNARRAYGIMMDEVGRKASGKGSDEEISKAEQEYKSAVEHAKKIKEEVVAAGREAQTLRERAAELVGADYAAKLRNEAERQRIENERREDDAAEKKREDDERKVRRQNLDDRQLERLKQAEISALDPASAHYESQRREIERSYERRAVENRRDRATNDEDRKAANEELQANEIRYEVEDRRDRANVAQDYFGNLARQIDASRPQNRLTAMGLGSGDGGNPTVREQAQNVKLLVELGKQLLAATRDNKPSSVATYSE